MLKNTGGWQDYTEVYCELNKNVSGVHNLFLGFVGDRDGLFNVNWFRFTKSAYDPVMADSYDEKLSGAYKYNFIDFGEGGNLEFKVDFSQKVDGTIDVRLGSPTSSPVASINVSNETSVHVKSNVKGSK